MALSVTGDTSVIAILKEYYGVQDVEALVFRNSPVLGKIKKKRVGGKYVPLPVAAYGNGAVTADYTQVSTQAANSYIGLAFFLVPGQLFSSFVLDPKEFLASEPDRGAFIEVFAIRAMFALDDLRKTLATCLYNTGFLEMGVIRAVDATNFLYVDVDPSTAMALTPASTSGGGSQILFAPTPTSAYRAVNAIQIASIANQQNTGYTRITFQSAYVNTVAVGDYVMLKGGRDAQGNPNAPVGFNGWFPITGFRASTSSAWTTQIGTPFYNVNRSVAPDRLAGQFVQRNSSAGESYTAALLRLLKTVRRAGGDADLIVVNDDDYAVIMNDALANRTFYSDVAAGNAPNEAGYQQGISQFQMIFSTSWINKVVDDPYCTKGVAYILSTETIGLYTISNAEKILDKLPLENEPGAPRADSEATPTKMIGFLWDDFYTTSEVPLQSGMGIRVDYNFYGNFGVSAPAHNGVVVF